MPDFSNLSTELRLKVYEYVHEDDSVDEHLDNSDMLPSLAYVSGLIRREFVPEYVGRRPLLIHLVARDERERAGRHLAAFDSSILGNVREFHITINDDREGWKRRSTLMFSLGGSVRYLDPSPWPAGEARVGDVHVVFTSIRGRSTGLFPLTEGEDTPELEPLTPEEVALLQQQDVVARRAAAAINRVMFLRAADAPLRLSARELRRALKSLQWIHGIRLDGFKVKLKAKVE